eukprot:352324-Chlamydomonas_euryale.AAC.4
MLCGVPQRGNPCSTRDHGSSATVHPSRAAPHAAELGKGRLQLPEPETDASSTMCETLGCQVALSSRCAGSASHCRWLSTQPLAGRRAVYPEHGRYALPSSGRMMHR